MNKKLYRSLSDRKLCGVCGGIAAYCNLDSNIVRLIWALLSLVGGGGVILYLIAMLIIPDEPIE